MEKFSAEQFIDFLGRIEKLKSVPRHCVTADGVVENVAAHSWRTAVMAYLMKDELEDIDTDKVIRMCLLHDIGEAVTGDIPTFEKTEEHEEVEKRAVDELLQSLPGPLYQEITALFEEMDAQAQAVGEADACCGFAASHKSCQDDVVISVPHVLPVPFSSVHSKNTRLLPVLWCCSIVQRLLLPGRGASSGR